jgi:hypothetical protein
VEYYLTDAELFKKVRKVAKMEIRSTSDQKELDSLSGKWPPGVIFERNISTHRRRLMSAKNNCGDPSPRHVGTQEDR